MGFCSCTVKFLMLVFNLICAITGIIILVVGVMINTDGGNFKKLITGEVTNTSVAIMVLGGIVFLIAFFGCCGALREDTCMIQTYAVLLLIIIIAEVAVGITAFVYKKKIGSALDDAGQKIFDHYKKNQEVIDEIQKDLKCCGFTEPYSTPPDSCHEDGKQTGALFKRGCRNVIADEVRSLLTTIGAAAISIGAIELLGVLCAFYVASSIKRQNRRGYA